MEKEKPKVDTIKDLKEGLDRLKKSGSNAIRAFEIPIDKIRSNPNQPRKHFDVEGLKDLGEDIKTNGLIQPIIVREINDLDSPQLFEICAGERRWRASKLVGLATIQAVIKDINVNRRAIMTHYGM